MKKLVFGILIGALLATGIVYAVEYVIEPNPYQMTLNGEPVWMEGYNINGYSYFKLRDIGEKVGFSVDFLEDKVVIDTETPQPSPTATPMGELPEFVYAVDGLQADLFGTKYYVVQRDIKGKYKGNYAFRLKENDTYDIYWRKDGKDVVFFDNYPQGGEYNLYVELEWYNTVLQPWLASEGWRMQ